MTAMMSVGHRNFSVMQDNSSFINGHDIMSRMPVGHLNSWTSLKQMFCPMHAFLCVVTNMFLQLMDLKNFDVLNFQRTAREAREWNGSWVSLMMEPGSCAHDFSAYLAWLQRLASDEETLARNPPVCKSLTLVCRRKCTNVSCFRLRSPIFFFYEWRCLRPRSHQFNRHIYCFPLLF